MANRWIEKAVYIRETTDGKTKWVKIPGIMIQNGYGKVVVYLDHEEYSESEARSWTGNHTFERDGRAE